ncbi:hypothetical protein [Alkalibacter mobilis]|uniref:hypothetical protein n=1 Tax=Alkalibacter mobilis TaxID=2787712 RepID=UPI0018A01FAC|nr:hypothetical protein [Alkalibacter mobilis]MBF7097147.1 hypothetical protein [Alkalibacter mobilis]
MDGLALLGLFLIIYSFAVVALTVKKPKSIWEMAKIRMFRKILGEKGTVIFFYIFSIVAFAAGIWLMVFRK